MSGDNTQRKDPLRGWKIAGIVATLLIIMAFPLYLAVERSGWVPAPVPAPGAAAAFVGSQACRECHKQAYDKWKGSHHERAMDVATDESVRGDFQNAVFEHLGVTSKFYRKDGKFFVRTAGVGGEMQDFQISHTFGWFPLQQYLVAFPGGRLQCLPIAWDVRQGRWYHLYPNETLDPSDWLYWTNAAQNWNGMCAECHSTNLQKNYDPDKDTYQTIWSEINVGCEACHGPASRHVAWAELPDMARPQGVVNYELTVVTSDIGARRQVELCAPCHSRRAILGDYTHHEADLLDSLLPSLLIEGLYFADGQILDEVYVYGSFTQSKMYHRDVRCSDCHDVHSTTIHEQDNALCLQCHRSAVYDTPAHHFHKRVGEPGEPIRSAQGQVLFEVGSGARCAQCHMPGRDYMVIDYRPDHSFRIPRPDLTIQLGTPNACSRCHQDKSAQWAEQAMTQWYGPGRAKHYAQVIEAGRRRLPEARADLIGLAGDALYPVIVRSTALDLLGSYPGPDTQHAIQTAMTDPEALIRRTATNRSALLPPERRRDILASMIYDPVSAVRMEAAYQMSAIAGLKLPPDQQRAYQSALLEYQNSMNYSADFAFGRFNLGNLYTHFNQRDSAITQYEKAIQIDDQFYMAKVNLAVLYSQKGDNDRAEQLLREALTARDDLYDVHYSLGLLLAEERRYAEAARHLETAAAGLPDFARAHYNLGQLLDFLQRSQEAQAALERAHALEPQNSEYLKALVQHYLRFEKFDEARRLAGRMLDADPRDPAAQDLMKFLQERTGDTQSGS
jgi:tetratricopeptide (TPR) repeat protein